MAPLLNAHCQQPGPSRHHLSLDARHSFLMVPSPELQLSFTKHPWRPSVHNQESFVQLFGCHLPSVSASEFPAPPRSRALPSSQSRPHSGIKCHVLPYLRILTPADPEPVCSLRPCSLGQLHPSLQSRGTHHFPSDHCPAASFLPP